MLKGNVTFYELNWKNEPKGLKENGKDVAIMSNYSQAEGVDWTLACESGGLKDLEMQLKWIGKEGMIVGFMEHEYAL
jgi:predicted HAD superfamily phosphohydrolase